MSVMVSVSGTRRHTKKSTKTKKHIVENECTEHKVFTCLNQNQTERKRSCLVRIQSMPLYPFSKKVPCIWSSFLLLFIHEKLIPNEWMHVHIHLILRSVFEIRRFYAETFIMKQHSSISSFDFSSFVSIFHLSFSFCFFFRVALFLNDFCCTLKTYALNECSWQQRAFSCTQFSIACAFSLNSGTV